MSTEVLTGGVKHAALLFFIVLSAGCAPLKEAYSTHSLNQRITSSQNSWRTTGSGFSLPGAQTGQTHPSPELQQILDRLVYVSPLRGFDIRAYIVEDSQLNAFSDGKAVYFHRPLLNLMQNDPERIAGVMSHELGHIIGNHAKNRVTRATVQTIANALAALSKNQNASSLTNQAVGLGSLAYDRNEEKEADVMGAVIAHKAGYDPAGLSETLQLMQAQKQQDGVRYMGMLTPHVNAYNKALSNYQSNLSLYNTYGSQDAYNNAAHWAQAARQHAANINTIVAAIQQNLGKTNPLYLSHPPEAQRIQTVSLIRTKEKNRMSLPWLSQQDPSAAKTYATLETRTPK